MPPPAKGARQYLRDERVRFRLRPDSASETGLALKQAKAGNAPETAPIGSADPVMRSIPYMVQVVARLQTICFMADLAGTGVHPAESYVIHELWKEAPLSQSQVSARLEIGNATVGKTIQRLERNGFVERARVTDDRRRIMVKLTAKGEAAHARLDKATDLLIADIEQVLGKDASREFLKSLNTLANHFRGCLPDAAPAGESQLDHDG